MMTTSGPLVPFMALLGHWRRHKIQLATLFAGLVSATALWTAVQALNTHARDSYDRSAATVAEISRPAFVATDGTPFDEQAFAALRRAGLMVTPVVEGHYGQPSSAVLLTGIDPPSYGPVSGNGFVAPEGRDMLRFLEPPGVIYANAETATVLALLFENHHREPIAKTSETETSSPDESMPEIQLPEIVVRDTVTAGTAVGDIAIVQRLLGLEGRLSKLILPSDAPANAAMLPEPWLDRLKLEKPAVQVDLAGLTSSFHLNLTAFGLLCFLVGLFIVYSAIGLAFEDRLPALRTLRVCGVSRRQLLTLMVIEMTVIAAIAGAIGILAGYGVASLLLPDVAASLRGLYGARIGGVLALDISWWLGGLSISILGALGAAAGAFLNVSGMSLLETRGSPAWVRKQADKTRNKAGLALILLSLALIFYGFGDGLFAAFMVMAGILLGAAFLLPALLLLLLHLGQGFSRQPLWQWFWSDSRQQLSGLALALMALLLALGTNIGVSGMVQGFRHTFNAFLDERLSADLYVQAPSSKEGLTLIDWAHQQPEITAVLPIWSGSSEVNGLPVNVVGFEDHPSYRDTWTLLSQAEDAWRRAADGTGILANEQLSYKQDLRPGDILSLSTDAGTLQLPVVGIYADYGNPRAEVRLPNFLLVRYWPSGDRNRLALHVAGDIDATAASLRTEFQLPANQVIDQAGLKRFSQSIFEKTFTISDALSGLTLGVAGIAMVTSLLTLAHARLNGVAPLWAMGVRRQVLTRLELLKILLLALLTAIVAIPLGVAITWCLVAVINVEAFGWRLPLYVFPDQWGRLVALGMLTAFVAALYPVFRLQRTPPAELSKVFAHEH